MRVYRSEGSFFVKTLRNIVLILLLIIFVSIVLHFRNRERDTVSALMADATASSEYKGVFIRKEEPVTYSGNGILSYNVSDGGKLSSGGVIAQVYPNDEQVSINREIDKLTRELDILEMIQNPGTLESAQPSTLSEGIKENYRSLMYSRDMKDYNAMQSAMDDLLIHLSTYQIITNEVADFSQQVSDINESISSLKQSSVAPSETIYSPRSAYFVSYCDGYEDKFTEESLGTLTVADIENADDKKLTDSNIVGKLVDGYTWYLAVIADNSKKMYAIGDIVKLRFGPSADTCNAEIHDIRDEGDPAKSIIVLSCSRFNYDMVQHRCELVELIKGEYSGLKVPREAIRFVDLDEELYDEKGNKSEGIVNTKGVYILKGEQVDFKKIDVIYEGSDYVLSAEHTGDSDYLSLYDDIIIEGVDQLGK